MELAGGIAHEEVSGQAGQERSPRSSLPSVGFAGYNTGMVSLFVIRGRDQGKHFPLTRDVTRIGRDSTNDVQLLDHEASRSHAEVRLDQSSRRHELLDLQSSNGTFVNGQRIDRHPLKSGDRIEIGGTLLIFTGGGHSRSLDAAHGVDIVQQVQAGDASQIVSSLARSADPHPAPPRSSMTRSDRGIAVSGVAANQSAADASAPGASNAGKTTATELDAGKFDAGKLDAGKLDAGGTAARDRGAAELGAKASDSIDSHRDPADPDSSSSTASVSEPTEPSSRQTFASDADRSLEVMYSTALAVGRTEDLDELLRRVLRLVFDWVEADRGCVMLRDPETKRLTPAARCDRDVSRAPGTRPTPSDRITISHTILDYVIRNQEGVRTSDAPDDTRFDSAASIVRGGVREALCVPLQGRYDIVGALYVDTYTPPGQLIRESQNHRGSPDSPAPPPNRFHDEHLRLITAIGHQAALAIEDTFYYSALLRGERLAAMGQTIATLSHHIKNILQGVRGGSYLIETGLQRNDTDAIRKGWAMVDRNQERISHLVLDMLTFSKERTPQRVDADLNATIRDVAELMTGRAAECQRSLDLQLDSGLPLASFDPDAIHRALLNLVTNAIDASQTRVCISSSFDAAEGWRIDVDDDGDGVAEEEREAIFSVFESDKGARGTGLGLPVSAKIMSEHGGTLVVQESPLGGARFRCTLPTSGTDIHETIA